MTSTLIHDVLLPIELLHYERLRWIEREDLSDVAQKLRQENRSWTEAHIEGGLENLRRYYSLSVLDPLNFHAVPVPLDPFWHTHLLFSRDYAAFCEKVFGQFIHHQPLLETDPIMTSFVRDLYKYTWELQSKLFRAVSKDWWPPLEIAGPICYHMHAVDPLLREAALFPKAVLKRRTSAP